MRTEAQELERHGILVNVLGCAVAFGAWVALGPAASAVAQAASLDAETTNALRALPILVGAALRPLAGMLADRHGARVAWVVLSLLGAAGLVTLSAAGGFITAALGAALLGAAGACFSVAVQAVTRVVSRAQRGFSLGLLGAGDVGGVVIVALLPTLLAEYGWRAVMRGLAVLLVVTATLYAGIFRADTRSPRGGSDRALFAPLRFAEGWRLGLAHAATYGVFIALALTGTDLLVRAFGRSEPYAALSVAIFAVSAVLARIPGGTLADRWGARVALDGALVTQCTALVALALHPSSSLATVALFVAGLASGVGSAAATRLAADRFPAVAGSSVGHASALGAVGGCALAFGGGALAMRVHQPAAALVPMFAVGYLSLVLDHLAARRRARVRAALAT